MNEFYISAAPKLYWDANEDTWKVDGTVVIPFKTDEGPSGSVHILNGFPTDGASVPRAAWLASGHPLEMPRLVAALAHDWLYASQVVSRALADQIYRAINLSVGRPRWKVEVEYWTLRLFGGKAWQEHTNKCDPKWACDLGAITFNN